MGLQVLGGQPHVGSCDRLATRLLARAEGACASPSMTQSMRHRRGREYLLYEVHAPVAVPRII